MLNWHFRELSRRLDRIEDMLSRILGMERHAMALIDDLTAAAAAQSSVDDSIEALLDGIAKQLADALAANNPAAIQAVIDTLTANQAKVTAAIVRNTPVTPAQTAATT